MTFGRFVIAPVFALLASAYLMTGSVYWLYADPPLLECQIPTPAQCPSFNWVQCADTDPGYSVEWEEQFEEGVSAGWKPIFVVPPCEATETVSIDTSDEVQCGGVTAGGTHITELEESHKVCWGTRWCLTTPAEQGGPPIVTLSWRTGPNGGGLEIIGKSESHQRHLCQAAEVDPGTILQGDEETALDWFKCVPYSNCHQGG